MPASGRSPAFAACCSAMKKYLSVSGGSPSPNDDVATTITSKFFASSANSSAVLGAAEPSSTFSCFTSTPPAFQPLIVLFIAMRVYPLSVPTTTTTRGAMMQRTVVGEARRSFEMRIGRRLSHRVGNPNSDLARRLRKIGLLHTNGRRHGSQRRL